MIEAQSSKVSYSCVQFGEISVTPCQIDACIVFGTEHLPNLSPIETGCRRATSKRHHFYIHARPKRAGHDTLLSARYMPGLPQPIQNAHNGRTRRIAMLHVDFIAGPEMVLG